MKIKKNVKITDEMINKAVNDLIDDIIETVLNYVNCEHGQDKEVDGLHAWTNYYTEQGCEEAVREVLGGKI